MRSELKALKSQMALNAEANAASLAAEVGVRQKAESDRAVLESKLLFTISAVGQLRGIVDTDHVATEF